VPQGQSGTYFVKVTDSDLSSTTTLPYTLRLRPVGLDTGSFNPSNLSKTGGGLYAFLDGASYTDGSKVLDISGPVGHGFGIRGYWTESLSFANGLPGATYTATALPTVGGPRVVYLETPAGEVAMPLPGGSTLSVSTKPQQWGDSFGELGAVNWNAPQELETFQTALANLGPAIGLVDPEFWLASSAFTKFGIGLGTDTPLVHTGAPLNAAVPYLYMTVNPLASSGGGSITQSLSIILDPGDPFLYIGLPQASTIALNDYQNFPITAVAASAHGLIPYAPADDDRPLQWHGSINGHVYLQGEVNTTALTTVPSKVKGSLVLNLDPNHTGQVLGGATLGQILAMYVAPGAVPAFDPDTAHLVMTNFSAGLNGELDIAPFDKFQDIPDAANRLPKSDVVDFVLGRAIPKVFTMGEAALVYDGPTESAYFRGVTPDPFKGTPLEPFGSPLAVDIDAAIKPGNEFYLDAKGSFVFVGLSGIGGEIKIENNWPTTVPSFTIDANGNKLSTTQTAYTSGITADVQLIFGIPDVIRATLDVGFSISVDSLGRLNWSGSGIASVDLYLPNDGWQFWGWEWQHVGDVGIGVTNGDMWFQVNGHRYDFDLPH
jgi:hypothetical protein